MSFLDGSSPHFFYGKRNSGSELEGKNFVFYRQAARFFGRGKFDAADIKKWRCRFNKSEGKS